jgi:alanine dehydrogenase
MKIGCPKEIKNHEYRVGLIPATVKAYVDAGHSVVIQKQAGLGSGILDSEFVDAGAVILDDATEVWAEAEMIVKVKEPLSEELPRMKPGQLIYTYFHFAADERLTRACMERGISALAYETVQAADGSLPLLKPMSEVAGRMAPIVGAHYLARVLGGRGILLPGVPGVAPANVLVIGGGTVGRNAARVAAGLGAIVTILDIDLNILEHLGNILPPNVIPLYNDSHSLEKGLREAHLVVGAVLIPGAKAPKLITREHLKLMKPGSVIVDVAIDQGGCAETSHPTTHGNPIYVVDDIIHYCVANMPGAFARTSTFALNNCTVRYGLQLANKGLIDACRENAALKKGLNLYHGSITFKPVAEAFGFDQHYKPVDEVLKR